VISIAYLSKKLFSPTDNFELAKIYHTLAEIRAMLLYKSLSADYIFEETIGS